MKRATFGFFVFVAIFLFASFTRATEWTECFKKNGTSYRVGVEFYRRVCRPGDIEEKINSPGPQGPMGPVGPQGIPGSGSGSSALHLFDGRGQDLGFWIGNFQTLISELGVVATFKNNGALVSNIYPLSFTFYFSELNCAGTPYVDSGFLGSAERYQSVISGSVDMHTLGYFRTVPGEPKRDVIMRSAANGISCSSIAQQSYNVFPVEQITLPFTLPLVWPLTIGLAP